jgi:hypothetical protein
MTPSERIGAALIAGLGAWLLLDRHARALPIVGPGPGPTPTPTPTPTPNPGSLLTSPEPIGAAHDTWEPSLATVNASEALRGAVYDGGGPWDPSACASVAVPHALALRDLIRRTFAWARTIGTVRCSALTLRDGTQRMSLHAVGRALDAMTPSLGAPEGEQLANWIVSNAGPLGVQLVIWNRMVWQGTLPSRSRFRAYTGPNPHRDHVHVEVTNTPGPALVAY